MPLDKFLRILHSEKYAGFFQKEQFDLKNIIIIIF